MKFNFPEIKGFRGYEAQLDKIQEELNEARYALRHESKGRFAEESLDILHAVETLIRNVGGVSFAAEVAKVKIKNFKRGYYDDQDR